MTSTEPNSGRTPSAAVGTATRLVGVAAAAVAVLLVLVAIGSLLYWDGEGRPRSPEAFRELVAARGLVVEWSNNGPRGGDGVVVTECGDELVTVNDVDGDLWVQWDDRRARISASVIDEIERCNPASVAADPPTTERD